MEVVIKIINAFSINETGGNPAGVIFDGDYSSQHQKQLIATSAGFSETAFISKSKIADFKLDFFHSSQADCSLWPCYYRSIFTYEAKKNYYFKSFIEGTIDSVRQIYFGR